MKNASKLGVDRIMRDNPSSSNAAGGRARSGGCRRSRPCAHLTCGRLGDGREVGAGQSRFWSALRGEGIPAGVRSVAGGRIRPKPFHSPESPRPPGKPSGRTRQQDTKREQHLRGRVKSGGKQEPELRPHERMWHRYWSKSEPERKIRDMISRDPHYGPPSVWPPKLGQS